jgi:hypothetical protein
MAQTSFYDLSGGINQAVTKTQLGLDLKKIYWADAENVEILQNKGFIKQKGNTLFCSVPNNEKIIAIHELKIQEYYNLIIVTVSGKIYVFNPKTFYLKLLNKTLSGTATPTFTDFLNGVIVSSLSDNAFYIKNNSDCTIESCNLKDSAGNDIKTNVMAVYKGRVWAASGSALYFSALGKYNDFTTTGDAGYINNFYTDTDNITALKVYKEYLAIYKKNKVYILTGSTTADFAIVPFADRGTGSPTGVVNVNNKQYFINQSIFPLVVGELNQIVMGQEISRNIKPEFDKFDKEKFNTIIALHYDAKNQIWFFIPYKEDEYFHIVWIYDYENDAWFKRVLPQDISFACNFDNLILTCDKSGNVYMEDNGSTFSGEPIKFVWKSPFISLGDPNIRKNIDEFYFVLDESFDNNFQFSVYKNYDGDYKDDMDVVFSTNVQNMSWHKENLSDEQNFLWSTDETPSFWAVSTNSTYKADISESNFSVQLCAEGVSAEHSVAVIGLEFKEIFLDE